MSETLAILEDVRTGRVAATSIDREHGIIRGVKLLGESGNHDYPKATREAARQMFEGAKVFVDHPAPGSRASRSYRERMGNVRNVRENGDGLYGDWHFNPKHTLAEDVFWDAENDPKGVGFSINAHAARTRNEKGRVIVEELAQLNSIDLVDSPATTRGLFESEGRNMSCTIRQISEALKQKRPRYVKVLQEMAEAGVLSPEAPMEMPAEEPAGDEADHEQAILDAAKAVIDDGKLSIGEKLKKIRALLKMVNGSSSDSSSGDSDDDERGEEEMAAKEESRKLKLENTGLKLLLEAGLKPSKVLSRAMAGCATEAEMKELIEEAKTAPSSPQKTRSAGQPPPEKQGNGSQRVQEGRSGGTATVEVPEEPKALGRWLQTPD